MARGGNVRNGAGGSRRAASEAETAARDLALMKAVESADRTRSLWSDADREWATRAAAEVVTGTASESDFLFQRAALTRARLVERHSALRRTLVGFTWPGWLGPVIGVTAFVAGFLIDRVGDDGRINILAPPVLGLCAWNVAVYAVLAWHALQRTMRLRRSAIGPVRDLVLRLAQRDVSSRRLRSNLPIAETLAAFATSWSTMIGPVYAARAARILHVAAALVACGMLAGLYLRGLAFEYRASWQSTFLDPSQVHAIVRTVLAPGSWLTRVPLPTVEHVAALRTSAPGAGENAAVWVHLYAATVALVVIVPRGLLALIAFVVERGRRRRLLVIESDPYYARLARMFRQGPLQVVVLPYSFALTDAARDALAALFTRAFGSNAMTVRDNVAYGGEDVLAPERVPANSDLVVPVFNFTATPEPAAHGAFVSRIASMTAASASCVAIVDESAFRERWPNDDVRVAQRRDAWRELLTAHRIPAVFADLRSPDVAQAAHELEAAVEQG